MNLRLLVILVMGLVVGCAEPATQRPISEAELREQLLDYNKAKVVEEDSLIERFMRYHRLDFERTNTGMRYEILRESEEPKLAPGDPVAARYTIHLLDSTLCYDNSDGELLHFTIHGSDVAPGFHEMALLIGRNAQARAIWPARLGYGLSGDLDKIPLDAILLVDLSLQ